MPRYSHQDSDELWLRLTAGITLLIIAAGSIWSMTDPTSALELVVTLSGG